MSYDSGDLETEIRDAVSGRHVTLNMIRHWLSEARAFTAYYPQVNQTYYPYGWPEGARGDTSTARYHDQRTPLAVAFVAAQMGLSLPGLLEEPGIRLRDLAAMLADLYREQLAADALEDAHTDDVIV